MRHSFRVMHDELYTVMVKISPDWARWVAEKICHESQKAKRNGDGSLELMFRVAGLDEIKRWIFSLGPEAVILELPKLREMVRKDLYGMLGGYQIRRLGINLIKGDSGGLRLDS